MHIHTHMYLAHTSHDHIHNRKLNSHVIQSQHNTSHITCCCVHVVDLWQMIDAPPPRCSRVEVLFQAEVSSEFLWFDNIFQPILTCGLTFGMLKWAFEEISGLKYKMWQNGEMELNVWIFEFLRNGSIYFSNQLQWWNGGLLIVDQGIVLDECEVWSTWERSKIFWEISNSNSNMCSVQIVVCICQFVIKVICIVYVSYT